MGFHKEAPQHVPTTFEVMCHHRPLRLSFSPLVSKARCCAHLSQFV